MNNSESIVPEEATEPKLFPVKIERIKAALVEDTVLPQPSPIGLGIEITWSDKSVSTIKSSTLRTNCPCASCLEKRGDSSHAKPLSAGKRLLNVIDATADEELDLRQIWTVGNYALGMTWGDEHDTGIFTFRHLRKLAEKS